MQNLIQCLSSEHNYKFLKAFKQNIQNHDEDTLALVVDTVQRILQDPESIPLQKVLSVRLVKELMDLHQSDVIGSVGSSYLLQEFEKVAVFDISKAKYYFSDKPSEQLMVLGNTFVRLVLECIFVWNIWHPSTQLSSSPFGQSYERLLRRGVQFPKLHYFQASKVREYYLASREEANQKSAYFQNSSQALQEQEFIRTKKVLESNKYSVPELQDFISKLASIFRRKQAFKHLNEPQLKLVAQLRSALSDYEQLGNVDDLQITVQAICLEYDEEVMEKLAAIESFQQKHPSQINTPSKIQAGGYSTDNQFLSNGSFSSHNSTQKGETAQKQIQILSEKNKRIEQLIAGNAALAEQIKAFEKQVAQLKRQGNSYTNSKDASLD